MTPLEALLLMLMVAAFAAAYIYRALLIDVDRRYNELSKAVDEMRARERRYRAAHDKARTP